MIGGWFTTSFSLTFGEQRYAVERRDAAGSATSSPRRGSTARSCSASARRSTVWRKFLSPIRPPLYPRLLRHADARAGVRARRRRAGRDAERAGAAAHDEPHARAGSARCRSSSRSSAATSTSRSSGARHRIFFEEAGQGIPLLCLHTAGADSRQYRHVLNDARVTGASASSRSTCPITAARRRPTAGGSTKYRLTTGATSTSSARCGRRSDSSGRW